MTLLGGTGGGKHNVKMTLISAKIVWISSRLCRTCVTSDPYAAGPTFARSAFTGEGTRDQKAGRTIYNFIYHRVDILYK